MNPADFELNVWVAAEPAYAGAMRDLAAHAARYAGCEPQEADRYASAVERVVRGCIGRLTSGSMVPVVFRRGGGPLECLIACEGRFDAAADADVSVTWTSEQGTTTCRVAVDV